MKRVVRSLLCVSICLFIFLSLAGAIHPEWKLVSRISGNVESLKAHESDWLRIHQSKLLEDGDRARTLKESRAKIQLADQSVVTIGEKTTVEMSQFKLKENARIVELKLLAGKVRVKVAKFLKGDSHFEMRTNESVLAARGTDFYVEVQKEGQAFRNGDNIVGGALEDTSSPGASSGGGESVYFCVYQGIVEAHRGTQSHTFYAGESGFITAAGAIIVNPKSIPSSFSAAPGDVDQDLREAPEMQSHFEPPQPPPGFPEPGSPPPPPVLIQPAPVNTGTLNIQVHW